MKSVEFGLLIGNIEVDLTCRAVLLLPRIKPKKGFRLLVGASLPKNEGVNEGSLERLRAKYTGRLLIEEISDGSRRTGICLLCNHATLEESWIRGDRLEENITNFCGFKNMARVALGPALICENLGLPLARIAI